MFISNEQGMGLDEKILWLRIFLAKGIGPTKFWEVLKNAKGVVKDAFLLVRNVAGTETQAENLLLAHNKCDASLVFAYEPNFPKNLRELRDCPPVLSIAGNLELLNKRIIAIVGARNASLLGKVFARKMAQQLGESGLTVISGLARGIDAAAHEGSLKTGTIAVFAGGVDVVYPPENVGLCRAILQGNGVVLSEMMPGTKIDSSLFPRRNRIIAGMAVGIVVVEAALKSGSLITARCALEHGKEIFVVPGSPFDARSRGGNLLIKQGAALVESAEDVMETLHGNGIGGWGATGAAAAKFESETTRKRGKTKMSATMLGVDAEEGGDSPHVLCEMEDSGVYETEMDSLKHAILSELSAIPVSIEVLFNNHKCSLPSLLSAIGELELDGKVKRLANSEIVIA